LFYQLKNTYIQSPSGVRYKPNTILAFEKASLDRYPLDIFTVLENVEEGAVVWQYETGVPIEPGVEQEGTGLNQSLEKPLKSKKLTNKQR
jgi:hypothetical protein